MVDINRPGTPWHALCERPGVKLRQDTHVHLKASPTRCPYCHDEVREEEFEDAQVCLSCLARHHGDCWLDGCAMCGTTRALGETTASPVARSGFTPFRYYEGIKRWGNRLTILFFLLYFGLMMLAMPVSAALGLLDDPNSADFPWPMIPGMLCGVLLALTLLPVSALNFYDAVMRSRRDSSCGVIAFLCIVSSFCTAGVSGMGYYLRWGWQPLPADKPKRPTRRPGAKR